jgi:hypothetical protein
MFISASLSVSQLTEPKLRLRLEGYSVNIVHLLTLMEHFQFGFILGIYRAT